MTHLLLLHGAIGAQDQLEPLAQALSDDFLLDRLNFAGHGGQPMTGPFAIDIFAEQVMRYLDNQQIDRVDIFGYSMGGYVALYLAKMYPHRVRRIFTLGTKFEWTPDIAARETKMLNPEIIAEKIPVFAAALEKRHAPNDWKQVLSKTADMMMGLGRANPLVLDDFSGIDLPVLLGLGDSDTMVTRAETEAVLNRLPNARLTVLPQTPHPIEKADVRLLQSEILSFFK
ncbi:alpha/beta fold hydrolase [Flavobacterium caeni]|uniref:Esterase/lipase n=1 Tax=Flavobacterium caeni TaxID=490189 RepID=A0A1G5JIC0_9FLAO|nr:alpha/beta fold hydrolase [Flavobacterium caeni]SCY88067.1 Esterase/lipase [Flavobacterium caeni]